MRIVIGLALGLALAFMPDSAQAQVGKRAKPAPGQPGWVSPEPIPQDAPNVVCFAEGTDPAYVEAARPTTASILGSEVGHRGLVSFTSGHAKESRPSSRVTSPLGVDVGWATGVCGAVSAVTRTTTPARRITPITIAAAMKPRLAKGLLGCVLSSDTIRLPC